MSRILLIGDSILQGMTPFLPAELADLNPTSVVIEAVTGAGTRWWQKDGRIREKVAAARPDVVVLCLGTNDEGQEGSPSAYELLWDNAVTDAGMAGAHVVVVGPWGGPGAAERYGIIRGVVPDAINGLALVGDLPRGADGVHLNAAGYRILAERLGDALYARLHDLPLPEVREAPHSPLGAVAAVVVGLVVGGLILWYTEAI